MTQMIHHACQTWDWVSIRRGTHPLMRARDVLAREPIHAPPYYVSRTLFVLFCAPAMQLLSVTLCRDAPDLAPNPNDPWSTREFLVKWRCYSYTHCSWERRAVLEPLPGFKRVLNYVKKVDDQLSSVCMSLGWLSLRLMCQPELPAGPGRQGRCSTLGYASKHALACINQ
jgi:hypothetical protein